ncbi:MAG: phosphate starvation-inducible protein PhoH [Rhodospirillaceae bacterium]|nr:phosphate starvation-inducible protein PhoH [Rhodospirillaceae bacterium]
MQKLNNGITQLSQEFPNNGFLQKLYGPNNLHLEKIENHLNVSFHTLGNQIIIRGTEKAVINAKNTLTSLYDFIETGQSIDVNDIEDIARLTENNKGRNFLNNDLVIKTKKKYIRPKTIRQAAFFDALNHKQIIVALGPAGTGKTYLAVAKAVEAKLSGEVEKIILSRPAVEAGESLGYLPGDMRDKIDPYLRPLYDSLYDMMPSSQVASLLASGEIEIAPLAFMRGRTLSNAFIILDEAQNTTPIQMKMFLTRMGKNSKTVLTADLSQVDLPRGISSGIKDALEVLRPIEEVGEITMSHKDVIRHSIVAKIISNYSKRDKQINRNE